MVHVVADCSICDVGHLGNCCHLSQHRSSHGMIKLYVSRCRGTTPWMPNTNENITFTIRGDNNGPLSLKSWPYYPSEDAYILYISHAVLCTICSHACCMLWLIAVYVVWVTWEIAATFLNTDHSMACIWLNVEVPPLGSQIAKIPEWKIQQGISPSTSIINRPKPGISLVCRCYCCLCLKKIIVVLMFPFQYQMLMIWSIAFHFHSIYGSIDWLFLDISI